MGAAWAKVKSNRRLRGSFRNHLHGLRRVGSAEVISVSEVLARTERYKAFDAILCSDVRWLIDEIDPFLRVLIDANRIRQAHEYKCALRIAHSWLKNGVTPSITRNVEATDPPQYSSFQRFVLVAVPERPISDDCLRSVVETLGEASPKK